MHETFDINDVDAILRRVLQSPTEQVNFISDGRTMKIMSEDRSIDIDAVDMFDYYTKEEVMWDAEI
jgi:hypothetical protein